VALAASKVGALLVGAHLQWNHLVIVDLEVLILIIALFVVRVNVVEVDLVAVLVLEGVLEACSAASFLQQELAQIRGWNEAVVSAFSRSTWPSVAGDALPGALRLALAGHVWILRRTRVLNDLVFVLALLG